MKPLNTKERQSAFIYFLIFFIVTNGLIVLAVFFGMQIPFKQNEKMQQQVTSLQKQQAFAQNFSAKMSDARVLLDTVNRAGVPSDLIDSKITENLKDLDAMTLRDSSVLKIFYQNIVQDMSNFQFAKKQLRDCSNQNVDRGQLLQQLEEWKNNYNQLLMNYTNLRNQIPH